jgi:hypothetical protein
MRIPPESVSGTWPKANFVNPVRKGVALLVVEYFLLPLSIIVVSLRLYIRSVLVKKLWWDDFLMLWALVSSEFLCLR